MARKLRAAILIALLLVALMATQVLAEPSIRFTLNGAKERFNAGAVVMLYGRTEDSGLALPDADVFVKVQAGGNPVYWSQVRSDDNGYFRTNFNLSNNATGTMTVEINALGHSQTKNYQLGVIESGLNFNTLGFSEKPINKLIPVAAKSILLVFDSNVNYFKNNGAGDLEYIGINEKNADCARVYEKDTGKLMNTSVALVSNDDEGKQLVSYYDLDGQQLSETRRRIIPLSLNESLKPNTAYRVVINSEIAANNSGILGSEKVLEFTTQASTASSTTVVEQGINSSGGTISQNDITIVIPPNAVADDIKITVDRITDLSGLAMDNLSKLISDVYEIVKDKLGDFKKPVTLTLTFDKSQVDPEKYDIRICYLDEKENKWVPLDNIKVDMTAATVSGEVTHFTKFAVIAAEKAIIPQPKPIPELKDIQGHWAEKFVAELVGSGAIGGYPDGTFKPDQGISRAEFATILVIAFQLSAKDGQVFDDTANHWGREFIATAAAYGIVSGYSDTAFGPDDPITREQMAVMIVKAADLKAGSSEPNSFKDGTQISTWAAEAVAASVSNGIIKGYPDNTFRPHGSATRAEAATVIVQTLRLAS